MGDPEWVKKPYLVFVKREKIKGGDITDNKKETMTVHVVDGIGKFSTYDWAEKEEKNFEKPEYKFVVIGYLPLIPQSSNSSKNDKISFELKEFKITYEERKFIFDSFSKGYFGESTIIAVGDPALVKKPHIVLVRSKRTNGGKVGDPDTKEMNCVMVVDGIGKVKTNDFVIQSGKESIKGKLEKPEYKIEIIGYRTIET
jgi:hypothetical protein